LVHDWAFHAYLNRWDNIGVDRHHDIRNDYFLAPMNETIPSPADFASVPSDMVKYRLYRRSATAGISANGSDTAASRVGQGATPVLK
jgi:hypothetical protein